MTAGKITKRTLDALVEGSVAGFLWDQELKGFGLKTTVNGSASYVVQYRLGGREAKTKRYTIGAWFSLDPRDGSQRGATASHPASTLFIPTSSGVEKQSIWHSRLCRSFRGFLCRQGMGDDGPALASPSHQARPAGQGLADDLT